MTQYQRTEGWVGSQVDDSFVILHMDTGSYVALNPTATAIWEGLSSPQTAEAVVDRLMQQFAVERATCEASVARALENMVQLKLVEPA